MGGGMNLDKLAPESLKAMDFGLFKEAGAASGIHYQDGGEGEGEVLDELGNIIGSASKEAAGKIDDKRRAIARSRSVFTSPLGLGGVAGLARKFLLGE